MEIENKKINIKYLVLGFIAAVSACIICLSLFSLLMLLFDINSNFGSTFSSVSVGIGCFTGAFLCAKKAGKGGLIYGIVLSVLIFLIITVISLFFCFKGILTLTLLHFAIYILSGAFGGILGVNSCKNIY